MSDPEFRTEPISATATQGRYGRWLRLYKAARDASLEGNAIVFDCSDKEFNNARANLYHSRARQPGEKVHISHRDGVARVWLTFSQNRSQP